MHGIGPAVLLRNEVEAEGGEERRRNVEKSVLVMKYNKNINIP